MELFERVIKTKELLGSKSAIARVFGIVPQKLDNYCNPDSQKNLWPLLPKLLEAIPYLSRSWLYFGEGEMLIPAGDAESAEESGAQNAERNWLKIIVKQQETIVTLLQANQRLLAKQQETIDLLSQTNQTLIAELFKVKEGE